MNTVTHALAPVLIAHFFKNKKVRMNWRSYVAIGIAGALPDILNPHLTLESRLASWSHGIPFWVVFSVLTFVLTYFWKRRVSYVLAGYMSCAYLFHIVCDAISGGINLWHPFFDFVWGGYWVDPIFWIPFDALTVISCYILFRVMPAAANKKVNQDSD